jgi:hypothetical protein
VARRQTRPACRVQRARQPSRVRGLITRQRSRNRRSRDVRSSLEHDSTSLPIEILDVLLAAAVLRFLESVKQPGRVDLCERLQPVRLALRYCSPKQASGSPWPSPFW